MHISKAKILWKQTWKLYPSYINIWKINKEKYSWKRSVCLYNACLELMFLISHLLSYFSFCHLCFLYLSFCLPGISSFLSNTQNFFYPSFSTHWTTLIRSPISNPRCSSLLFSASSQHVNWYFIDVTQPI